MWIIGLYLNVRHLWGVHRAVWGVQRAMCGGKCHFLEQQMSTNARARSKGIDTRPHTKGSRGRGKGGGREEGERKSWDSGRWTWRDAVEYGLKGTAVFLICYAAYTDVAVPWYRAYRYKAIMQRIQLNESMGIHEDTATAQKDSDKSVFPGAKCATEGTGTGLRRSQRYNFLAEAVEKAAPSVVFIEKSEPVDTIFGRQVSVSTGSGFIVSRDGYVLTNAHVVGSARSVKVKLASGKVVKGEVTDLDQVADLALLKLSTREELPALEFGSSADLRPGEWVVALGSPLSLANTITAGIVSSCHRPSKELGLHRGGPDMQYVQTDAPITIGNSGGPLVNLDGEVIGVNTLTAGPGISFAIPSDFAREFVSRANKTTRRPGKFVIGISMLTVTPDLCVVLQQRGAIPEELECGVLVAQVWPSSVAAQAGLRKGDVIVRINGEEVTSSRQVYDLVQSGKRLHMEIVRNKSRITATLVPEKM